MELDKLEEYLKSLSDLELAQKLAENLEHYKSITMDPEATMSIPNINNLCKMANELSKRLAN